MRPQLEVEQLESLVATGFGIDPPVAWTRLPSMNNDVFRVASASHRAILKVYGRGLKPTEEIRWEHDLLAHLRRAEVAVADMIRARNHEPFVLVQIGDTTRPAVLYQELAGHPAIDGVDEARCRSIGRCMGAFYAASDDFQSRHRVRSLDLTRIIRQDRALLRIRLADRPADQRAMLDLLDESERRLATLISGGLDWGVCQGDVSLYNMHILPDGSIAVYDFENAGYGWRAADLCAFRYDLLEVSRGWEAFLDGLTSRRRLCAAELSAIDWMLVPFWLYNLRWLVKAGGDGAAAHVDRAVRVLREWAEGPLLRDPIR
jgi:Ser/Thr protein kinase RdoA (MazF antagonist)